MPIDFSKTLEPETPPAGTATAPATITPASGESPMFSADLFKEAAVDLVQAPLAGIEKAGRGVLSTGKAVLGAVGVDTPALPPPYFEDSKAFPAQLVESATQFGIGWAVGGAVTKSAGMAAGIANDVVAQGIGTALVADPHAPTLANLVEQFPVLHNAVTDYLSTKGDDSIAFGKFKAALSDMAAQVPVSLIAKVVRGMKAQRDGDVKLATALKQEVGQETGLAPKPAVDTPPSGASVSSAVRDPSTPQLLSLQNHGGILQVEFDRKVTQKDLETFFPGGTVGSLGGAGAVGKQGTWHKVEFWGKAGLDFDAAKAAEARLGGAFTRTRPAGVLPTEHVQIEAPHTEVLNATGKPVFSITKEQADLFEKQVIAKVRSGNTEDLTHDLYSMVNHENMDSQHTVQQVVVAMSNIIKKPLDAAGLRTEGVMTNEMAKAGADILGQDPAAYIAKLRVMAQHADEMPSMIAAGNGYIQAFADDISSIASKIHFGAASPEDELRMASQINSFSEVFGLHASLRTGAARATQAGNIRTTTGANVSGVADALEAAGGSDAIRQVAKRLVLAGTNREAVVRTLEASWGRKLLDTHNEFWINGILSGVKTHLVNITSNTINTLATPLNQIVGGALRRDTQGIKDGIALYRGLTTQFKDSVYLAMRAFKTDTAILDPGKGTNEMWGRAISSANYKLDEEGFLGHGVDFLGKVIRFPGRFLTAEDEFFKQINYRAKLKVDASNQAQDLVAAGKLSQGPAVERWVEERFQSALSPAQQDKDALKYAQQATFTQKLDGIETWSGNRSFGAGLQTLASNHPLLRGTVLPFIKVPTNIMRSFTDHSLLAPLTKRFHADVAAGGERANLAIGKLATGNLLAIGAVTLAIEGHLTGSAYGDKDMQARQRESGWQPYSIPVGEGANKKYISFARLDPWGGLFGLVADFYQTSHHIDEQSRHDFATAITLAVANNIANKSYLQGLVEISSLIGTGDNKEHAVERFIQQRLGSYVPAYANLWSGNEEIKSLRTWYDGVLAKTPGYSASVESRRDYLSGEKSVAPDGYPWNAINPFTVSPSKNNPVRDELQRLTLSSAESKFAPPNTKLGTIDLTQIKNAKGQTAYDRWNELIGTLPVGGKTFEQALQRTMSSDRYKSGTDGTSYYSAGSRPTMVKADRERYETAAKMTMLKEFTNATTSDGVPVDLRRAAQTDAQNKIAERLGRGDKLKDISNLQ